MNQTSKRFTEEVGDIVDPETERMMMKCSNRLDLLLSEYYQFVECCEDDAESLLPTPREIDPRLAFHFIHFADERNNKQLNLGRKPIRHKPKFQENITNEDIASIAVTGEWVLSKQGVYSTGRERRSELTVGASHSPSMKKLQSVSLNR